MHPLFKTWPWLSLMILWIHPALGTQDLTYGLGGSSTGRASSVTAERNNPFAALLNPALLGAGDRPLFEMATASASAYYSSLGEVLVDSPQYRTQSAVSETASFTPSGFNTTLWSVGVTYPFSLPKPLGNRRAGIGAVISGPFGKLRSFSSSTPYDFGVLRYGKADSQFKATVATGIEVFPQYLYVGAGISFYITAAGAADALVVTDNPTARLNLDVGLNSAAVVGLFSTLSQSQELSQHVGLVYRQAVTPTFQQQFNGSVQVVSGTNSLNIPMTLQTSLYYEPQSVELEWQGDLTFMTISAGVSYQIWSQYQPSFIQVTAPNADQQNITTQVPSLSMHNTLNPRISAEIPLLQKKAVLALGYQYRPTPVGDLSGPSNLLDTNTHVLGFSARYQFGVSEWVPFPVSLSLYGQYHFLETRTVVKSDPTYIGAPGYQFGGTAYTYGAALQANF